MRLLFIRTLYSHYWKPFYARNSGLESKSYAEQHAALTYDAFGGIGSWPEALGSAGYEVQECFANVSPCQKAWAEEHGLKVSGVNRMHAVVMAQARAFRPDVVWMNDYSNFPLTWLKELRKNCPSIRLMLGWCGAPFNDPNVFRGFDVVLSCSTELVEQFRDMGHCSERVNHAFDPRILDRIDLTVPQDIPLSFVGSIIRQGKYHLERERLLERLVRSCSITIFTPGADVGYLSDLTQTSLKILLYGAMRSLRAIGLKPQLLRRIPLVGKAGYWTTMPMRQINPRLRPYLNPSVFGLAMYQILRRSGATLNTHIDMTPRTASNIRLFEATGTGTCLLTDWKENLSQLFEVDAEVVAYRSPEECVEKARWLSEHPEDRDTIAKAGHARTLKEHTYAQRAVQIDSIIKRGLK